MIMDLDSLQNVEKPIVKLINCRTKILELVILGYPQPLINRKFT